MLLLFLPQTPMLFMGQEWAATSPFLYFTDHGSDLGERVSKGRREEFEHFTDFADDDAGARVPDPQAADTFARSKLAWDERERPEHARIVGLYAKMLALRTGDAVLSNAASAHRRATSVTPLEGGVLEARRSDGDQTRTLYVNFTKAPVPVAALAGDAVTLICASREGALNDGILAGESAVLVAM